MDLWKKPTAGDPLTFPASLRAAMIDTVKYVEALRRSEQPNHDRMAADRGLIKIKNESGTAVDRFGILGIDGIISAINPTDNLAAWKNAPVFSGIEPATPDHYGKFCVLVEPLDDDGLGWACVSGVVPVQVSFTYSDSPYADVLDTDDEKLVGSEGGMPILYKESGTGTKWALVQMGVPYYPTIRGKLDGDLNSGSSATLSVWSGATLADSSRDVTVYDASNLAFITAAYEINTGVAVTATWVSGKWYLQTPGACEIAQ